MFQTYYLLLCSGLSVQFTGNSLTGYRQRLECFVVHQFIDIDKPEHHHNILFEMVRFKVYYWKARILA